MTRSKVCLMLVATVLSGAAAAAQRASGPHVETPAAPAAPHPHHGHREYGAMSLVPPGMWWKIPAIAGNLSLTPEQGKRMDDIFHDNRTQLFQLHTRLEEAQANFEPLLNGNTPDQNKVLAAISQIADLRADLEKANGKMLVELRSVLTAAQWNKLQEARQKYLNDGPDHFHKDPPNPPRPPQ